jgi:hypothetical protein
MRRRLGASAQRLVHTSPTRLEYRVPRRGSLVLWLVGDGAWTLRRGDWLAPRAA